MARGVHRGRGHLRGRDRVHRLFVPWHAGDPGRTLRRRAPGLPHRPGRGSRSAVGAIGFGGFFAVYSYVAPMVTEVAGSPEWVVPIVLVLMGLGMTIGNLVGRSPRGRRTSSAPSSAGSCARARARAAGADRPVDLGARRLRPREGSWRRCCRRPSRQARMMDVAEDNQSIAAALNHSALSATRWGPSLGGAIAFGLGFVAPAWVGGAGAGGPGNRDGEHPPGALTGPRLRLRAQDSGRVACRSDLDSAQPAFPQDVDARGILSFLDQLDASRSRRTA